MFDGQELPGELMQTFEKFFLAPAISALSFKTVETCMVKPLATMSQDLADVRRNPLVPPSSVKVSAGCYA